VEQRASIVRAAAALRRREVVVRERARKLGCPFPPLRIAREEMGGQHGRRGFMKRPESQEMTEQEQLIQEIRQRLGNTPKGRRSKGSN
jgi:hypothetical protein